MNGETGFCIAWVSGRCLSVGLLRIRGELAIGGIIVPQTCIRLGSLDPDHDAVMRIGGEAPGGGTILSVGIKCQVRIRRPATSDRNSAVVLKPARAPKIVVSAVLVRVELLSGHWT